MPTPQKSSSSADTYAIVDDHGAVADMLSFYLGQSKSLPLRHAGNFKTVKDALEQLPKLKPAPKVVIIDFRLGDGNGLEVMKQLSSQLPNTLWLLFTGTPKLAIHDAVKSHIHGCVSKASSFDDVLKAIEALLRGEQYFDRETTAALAAIVGHTDVLTATEKKILCGYADGKEPKEIADDLKIGIKTVHNCTATIRAKLAGKIGNGSYVELARYAVEHGLAPAS